MRLVALFAGLALVAACDGKAPAPGDESPAVPRPATDSVTATLERLLGDRYDVEHCMFDSTASHPDGVALIEEFVQRARVGAFDHSESWMPGAFLCAGVEPGYDAFYVLDGVKLEVVHRGTDSVSAVIRSRQLGYESSGFHPETATRLDTLTAHRTRYGWRLRGGFWNWVDREEAARRGWMRTGSEASPRPHSG